MSEKFPKKFIDEIGEEIEYNERGKLKYKGMVCGLRWSLPYIMNLKTKKQYFGIELMIETDDRKYKWTTAFNSGIEIKE